MRKTCNKIIITELSVPLWRRTDNFAAAGCLYPKSAVRKIAWNKATKCRIVFPKCWIVFSKCWIVFPKCWIVFSKCWIFFYGRWPALLRYSLVRIYTFLFLRKKYANYTPMVVSIWYSV